MYLKAKRDTRKAFWGYLEVICVYGGCTFCIQCCMALAHMHLAWINILIRMRGGKCHVSLAGMVYLCLKQTFLRKVKSVRYSVSNRH